MGIVYRKAGIEDIELLTRTRVQVLLAANKLAEDVDMSEVEVESRRYYEESLADASHVAYLAWDGDEVVGTGGVSFFQVMPTYHNPSGRKAYVMNMYTRPDHRRQGIALQLLDRLVQETKRRGLRAISLEATEMGRPLYERYGFIPMDSEMELPE